jgi:hypothetical protein
VHVCPSYREGRQGEEKVGSVKDKVAGVKLKKRVGIDQSGDSSAGNKGVSDQTTEKNSIFGIDTHVCGRYQKTKAVMRHIGWYS